MKRKIIQPEPWKLIKSEQGPDLNLFQVRYNWMANPRNSHEIKSLILESGDWVNILALTSDNKVVIVRQYRFGVGKITAEIPGGLIDRNETPKEAAIRELQEETGYTSSTWKYLGAVEPNPAINNNLCHHWMAENATKTHKPNLDKGEDIIVETLSLDEIKSEIIEGRLMHTLVFSALSRFFDLWENDNFSVHHKQSKNQ